MSKKPIAFGLLLGVGLAASVSVVHAQAGKTSVYLIDGRGEVARSGTGLCWRTGFWTPAAAAQDPKSGCACDKDLLPRDVCEPPAPKAAPAAAPAPAPAPAPAAAPAAPVAAKPVTISNKSLFDFDKAVLKPEAKTTIDKEVVEKLSTYREVQSIIIGGHTDRIGSNEYNQKLSERRAEAVKAYLISKGVDAGKIETFGFGKTQPATGVMKCDDKLPRKQLIECLEPHRRVVIEVKGWPK